MEAIEDLDRDETVKKTAIRTRGNGAAVGYDNVVEHRNLSTAVGAAMAAGKS